MSNIAGIAMTVFGSPPLGVGGGEKLQPVILESRQRVLREP